jgi:hypothetical protein
MAPAVDFRGAGAEAAGAEAADEEGAVEDLRAVLEARGKVGLGLDRDFGMREI